MRRVAVLLVLLCLSLPAGLAGASSDPRIINGHPAPPGAYPWAVALVKSEEPAEDGQFCGGSLIAPQLVLTAAHCAFGFAPGQVDVVVGRYRLSERDGERIDVDRIAVDPAYDPGTGSSDAALLRLAAPASQPPVTLATSADEPHFAPGQPARVLGWGHVREGGPESADVLYEVDVSIDDQAACREAYEASEEEEEEEEVTIDDTMICASAPGRDACQGDSGGPLVVDEAGGWRQVGIVSFGIGCAQTAFPGVYARIPVLLDFINDPDPVFAPFNVSAPIPGGNPVVGDRLHCRPGRWQGDDVRFEFAWFRVKSGELRGFVGGKQNLNLKESLRGKHVACVVSGANRGGFSSEQSFPVKIFGR